MNINKRKDLSHEISQNHSDNLSSTHYIGRLQFCNKIG